MSNHTSNVCRGNSHGPSPADNVSIPEQNHKSIGPQQNCAIPSKECPVSPQLVDVPTTLAPDLKSVISNCDPPAKAILQPRLTLQDSIGRTALVMILGGTALIFASIAFLVFLWLGAGSTFEGKGAPWVWRQIALNDWTAQTTTLIALAISTVVVAQAAICTSMLAGAILEKGSVPRDKAAHFSILRATGEGPKALVSLILLSGKLKTIARAESILGLLLLAGTTTIQFSSTILLSDMSGSNLVGDVALMPVQSFVAPNQQRITTTQHLYSILNPEFAIYGERRSNTTVVPNSDGLSDTGIIDRVLLPISNPENRTAVRTYKGGAIAFSSRVACMRPEIRDFEFGQTFWDDRKGSNFGQLNATLDYGLSLKNVSVNDTCGGESCPFVSFSCYLAGGYDGYGWQGTICTMGGVGGSLWPFDQGPEVTVISEPWSINASITLVFSTNMRNADWEAAEDLGIFTDGSLSPPVSLEHEEWMSYQVMPGRFVNASLCFHTYSLAYSDVNMVATGDLTEPVFTYDSQTGSINTDAVQTFFGVNQGQTTPGERGLLEVHDIKVRLSNNINDSQALTVSQVRSAIYDEIESDPSVNNTRLACYHCSCGNVWPVHPELAQLLGNVLNSTTRAADAIQTYVSSMAFTVYRQQQKTFAGAEDAAISSVRVVSTAKSCDSHGGCWGLVSVITLVAIHLITVTITTALYVYRTRFSRQSNVWHAISQLLSEDFHDILFKCSHQSDKVVSQEIEKDDSNYMVRVEKLQGSGRVGIFRHA